MYNRYFASKSNFSFFIAYLKHILELCLPNNGIKFGLESEFIFIDLRSSPSLYSVWTLRTIVFLLLIKLTLLLLILDLVFLFIFVFVLVFIAIFLNTSFTIFGLDQKVCIDAILLFLILTLFQSFVNITKIYNCILLH